MSLRSSYTKDWPFQVKKIFSGEGSLSLGRILDYNHISFKLTLPGDFSIVSEIFFRNIEIFFVSSD